MFAEGCLYNRLTVKTALLPRPKALYVSKLQVIYFR